MALTKIKTGSVSDSITLTTPTIDGVLTANAGVVVDNFTLDGTTLALSSGNMTLDVAGNIILDADGGFVAIKDGGTEIGNLGNSSSDFTITSSVQDKDILFKGNDNGTTITALTLDMSAAGAATFNAGVNIGGNSNFLAPNINITADDARLVVQEADGTNMVWLGDLTGAGVGGCFLYNHGGTAVVQLRSDSASTIGHGLTVGGAVSIGGSITNYVATNSGNPEFSIGSSATNRLLIQSVYNSGSQILNYVTLRTSTTSGNADAGKITFGVDDADILTVADNGILVGTTTVDDARVNIVTTSGQWGIKCFSSAAGAQNFIAFNISGGGTNVGAIQTNGSSTSYVTSSDYRLKENVVPMTGSIDRVKALNPSRFNFIADADTTVDGFLAHEVETVVPEAISGTKDAMRDEEYEVTAAVEEVRDEDDNVTTEAAEAVMGTRSVPDMQGIDQSKLVPLLVAALQEAIARIEILEGA